MRTPRHPFDAVSLGPEPPEPVRRRPGRLPITNVMPDTEGRLDFIGREPLGPGAVNEAWWESVLDDPRARRKRVPGSWDTISRYPDMMFTAYCEKCSVDITLPTDDLATKYGPEMPVNQIAIELAGQCRTRPKWCKLRKFIRLKSDRQQPF